MDYFSKETLYFLILYYELSLGEEDHTSHSHQYDSLDPISLGIPSPLLFVCLNHYYLGQYTLQMNLTFSIGSTQTLIRIHLFSVICG